MKYFKGVWYTYSLKYFKNSRDEIKIFNLIKNIFQKENINQKVVANRLVASYFVDIFIEPNICIEVNGIYHYSGVERDSNNQFNGNFAVKINCL